MWGIGRPLCRSVFIYHLKKTIIAKYLNFDRVHISQFDSVTQILVCFEFPSIGGPWMPSDFTQFTDISSLLWLSKFLSCSGFSVWSGNGFWHFPDMMNIFLSIMKTIWILPHSFYLKCMHSHSKFSGVPSYASVASTGRIYLRRLRGLPLSVYVRPHLRPFGWIVRLDTR